MEKLAWGARIGAEERAAVVAVARRLRCSASALMAVIAFETGCTFSPSIANADTNATGLIQFLPSTASRLGTTVEQLAKMTFVEQMAWVEKYLAPYAGRISKLSDLYMAVLRPAALSAGEEETLFSEGTQAYAFNKGLDVDKDGDVSKREAAGKVAALLTQGLREGNYTIIEEEDMAIPTIVPILVNAIAGAVPEVAKLFQGKDASEVATRNSALVGVVAELAQRVTDAVNLQEATEKITENPVIAAEVGQAVKEDPSLSALLVEAGGGGIAGARAAVSAMKDTPGTVSILRVVTFWALGFLTFANVAGFSLVGLLVFRDMSEWQQISSALIQADIAAGFTALGFWLGSSLAKGGTPPANVRA